MPVLFTIVLHRIMQVNEQVGLT